ncbi:MULTISPECIES: hypothetical protein [unclassified Bradyrhizobium]|uniref:hypothetical protein n=1 Tax=unclassified Bradyrhizobium TaxID=2631580 RepID=UPI0029170880|nr:MULTISPECIES: hypothetical protein [unclassified Bradyrhizobium]
MFDGKKTAAVLAKLKEIYDEHIVVKTRFDSLKDATENALSEYKRLNERLIEKLEAQEKDRAKSEAEMKARIAMLEARLDAFSEKAMRYAVTDRVDEYLRSQKHEPRFIPARDAGDAE